jgi:hypothetical protein
VEVDDATVALRLLVDRRDGLGAARTATVNRLHRLLVELVPGGAKKFLSVGQARAVLAAVRPRDVAGRTRRQLAAELIVELAGIDKRIKAAVTSARWSRPATAPCSSFMASARPARPGCSATSATSPASPPARASPAGMAPPRPTRPPANRPATGFPARVTDGSTGSCTSWGWCSCLTTPRAAPTTGASSPPARPAWKPCAA